MKSLNNVNALARVATINTSENPRLFPNKNLKYTLLRRCQMVLEETKTHLTKKIDFQILLDLNQ